MRIIVREYASQVLADLTQLALFASAAMVRLC